MKYVKTCSLELRMDKIKNIIDTKFDNREVDLHMHSYFSDGELSPTDLIKKKSEEGVKLVSLTDHDGVWGIKEARAESEKLGLSFVSGVELSAQQYFNGRNIGVHILGYGVDEDNQVLYKRLKELEHFRRERNERLIRELVGIGYDIELKDVIFWEGQTYIGKPLIARALLAKGYIKTMDEAFGTGGIFDKPEIRAIGKKKIEAAEAIELIRESGGVPVIAHPGRVRHIGRMGSSEYFENAEKLICELKDIGLEGVEAWYRFYSETEKKVFANIGNKNGLILTRGSDFHGDDLEPDD